MTAKQKELFINLLRMHISNLETRIATEGENFSDGLRRDYLNKISMYSAELVKAKAMTVPEEDPVRYAHTIIESYRPDKGTPNELRRRSVLTNLSLMMNADTPLDLTLVECASSPTFRHSLVDADNEGSYGKQTCRYCGKEMME